MSATRFHVKLFSPPTAAVKAETMMEAKYGYLLTHTRFMAAGSACPPTAAGKGVALEIEHHCCLGDESQTSLQARRIPRVTPI